MSRHFFDCELRWSVRVTLGYNPGREDFYLEVERMGGDHGHGHLRWVYSSIHDLFDGGADLDYYRERLVKLGLSIPDSMFEAVKEDAACGQADRCAQHFADGRIVEDAAD